MSNKFLFTLLQQMLANNQSHSLIFCNWMFLFVFGIPQWSQPNLQCDFMLNVVCQVLLVRGRQAFDSIQTKAFCLNREFMMFFEDQDIYQRYNELLKHQCKICTTENEFKSFKDLRMHMQRQHQLFFCDLCVDNIKVCNFHVNKELVCLG
jgi:hypothetical protein